MGGVKSGLDPWTRLDQSTVYETRVFNLLRQRSRSPRTAREHDFFVLDAGDWVNIIPLTPENEVVLIRQYRHGIEGFTLEVPGGMVDATDGSPQIAAIREMQEETGYDASDVVPLGRTHPNPAIQGNYCHTFLARGAVKTATPSFDGTEETEVVLVPLAEIPSCIQNGQITHALVIVAFHWLGLFGAGRP